MVRKSLIIGLTAIVSLFSFNSIVSAATFGAPGFTFLRARYDNWEPIVFTGTNILLRGGIYSGEHAQVVFGGGTTPPADTTGTGGTTTPGQTTTDGNTGGTTTVTPGGFTIGGTPIPIAMPGTGGGGAAL